MDYCEVCGRVIPSIEDTYEFVVFHVTRSTPDVQKVVTAPSKELVKGNVQIVGTCCIEYMITGWKDLLVQAVL